MKSCIGIPIDSGYAMTNVLVLKININGIMYENYD